MLSDILSRADGEREELEMDATEVNLKNLEWPGRDEAAPVPPLSSLDPRTLHRGVAKSPAVQGHRGNQS